MSSDIGKCDRVENCNYHKTPKDHFNENPNDKPLHTTQAQPKRVEAKPTTFTYSVVDATTLGANQSLFYKLLVDGFGEKFANQLAFDYCLGSTKNGDVIFWQVDEDTNTRTGKIMKYGNDFKRDKNTSPKWVHSQPKYKDFNLKQCLFGLHLIKLERNKGKQIRIVESEKTAILANIIMSDKIWMATGGIQNLKFIKDIKKKVYLYPDKGAIEIWQDKAKSFGVDFKMMPFMENTDLPVGSDIADYILK